MQWRAEFNALAHNVGFQCASDLPSSAEIERPDEALSLWLSQYAAILIWEPAAPQLDIEERWKGVQDWFDAVLAEHEKDFNGTFDGFLVVVLSDPPTALEIPLISTIEADRTACRKQFLWPGRNGSENLAVLIQELTPLGLPASGRAVAVAQMPELSAEQRAFVETISQMKSGKRKAVDDLREIGCAFGEVDNEVE